MIESVKVPVSVTEALAVAEIVSESVFVSDGFVVIVLDLLRDFVDV